MRLVLASTSQYRKLVLQRLGVPFEAVPPGVDEDVPAEMPAEVASVLLAVRKAKAVAERPGFEGAHVIGSDQMCVAPDGAILGKPHAPEVALAQLARLSGRTHRLVTGVAVIHRGQVVTACDIHALTMRPLDEAALAAYVAHDQPLDCAGSYRLESRGIALFSKIEADPETADESAILGLPIMKTLRILRESFGVDLLASVS
jgi:septum formation protein